MIKALNLIKKADIVGIQLKPTLDGKNRIKSAFGGIISIAIVICIAFGFGYFSLSIITRDTPIMNIIQRKTEEATVTHKESPILITANDSFGNRLNTDPRFKRAVKFQPIIGVTRLTNSSEGTGYTQSLYFGKLNECTEERVSSTVNAHFHNVASTVGITLCADPDSFYTPEGEKYEGEIKIMNNYGDGMADYMTINVQYCDEKADPGCRDYLEEVGDITVLFYSVNYFIDQSDYDNPVKTDFVGASYNLSEKFSQRIFITIKLHEIVTDRSLFLSDTVSQVYYSRESVYSTIAEFNEEDQILLSTVYGNNKTIEINQRRYLKIPELLANMGGFMKAAFFIGNAISYIYSEYVYYLMIIEVEYMFKKRTEDKDSKIKKGNYVKKPNADMSHSKILPGTLMKQEKIPGLFDFTLSYFFSKKNSRDVKKHFRYLELNYVISKLLEIEELKNNEQS